MDAAVNQATITSTGDTTTGGRATDPWHLALIAAGTKAELDAGVTMLRARHGELTAPRNGLVEVHAAGMEIGRYRGAVLVGAGTTVAPAVGAGEAEQAPVAFMFPGLGDQYLNMAQYLYRELPVFRRHIDKCADMLTPELGVNLREVIFAAPSDEEERLNGTALAQPALFVIEYALAKLWQSLGVRPDIMIGYSVGEYVAACLAGVLSLKDSLKVVARRAKLIEESPRGSMLAVLLPEARITPLLTDRVSLAAVNGPESCVVAGHTEDVAALETTLAGQGVVTHRMRSTHALHSMMMEPLADAVAELIGGFPLKPPRIPYISNVTGKPITDEEATDPAYWAKQLCGPVRFADGIASIGAAHALLETGPGQALSSMATATRSAEWGGSTGTGTIVASMRHSLENQPDTAVLLKAFAQLWAAHAKIDWDSLPVSSLDLPAKTPAGPPEAKAETDRELTGTERRLVGLWARLLPGDRLPVDVSFFELGGNELLASRLIQRITKEFGVELTLRRLYEMSTITKMAAAIDAPLSVLTAEEGIDRIDLIKVDEQRVVEGSGDQHWPIIQQVELDVRDTDGRVAQLVDLLEGKGFIVRAELNAGTDVYHVHAARG